MQLYFYFLILQKRLNYVKFVSAFLLRESYASVIKLYAYFDNFQFHSIKFPLCSCVECVVGLPLGEKSKVSCTA